MEKHQLPEKGFHILDWRVGATLTASVIFYLILVELIPAAAGYVNLCILGICCVYLADTNWETTWKNGRLRVILTGMGAIFALIPVFVYHKTQNEVILTLVFGLGAVCVPVLAKFLNIMYIQIKGALVAYILTVYTFHFYSAQGNTGYRFCAMWIISTLVGLFISVAVAFVLDSVEKAIQKK